jgi:uncharacterized membrane protein
MKVDASNLIHAHRVSEQAYLRHAENLKRMQALVDEEAKQIKETEAKCKAQEHDANLTTGRVDVSV